MRMAILATVAALFLGSHAAAAADLPPLDPKFASAPEVHCTSTNTVKGWCFAKFDFSGTIVYIKAIVLALGKMDTAPDFSKPNIEAPTVRCQPANIIDGWCGARFFFGDGTEAAIVAYIVRHGSTRIATVSTGWRIIFQPAQAAAQMR